MPLYEYECEACGHRFEVIQKFSDAPVEKCVKCGGRVRKLLSSPAIQFKGSGWYITDYARAGKTEGKSETPTASTGTSEKPSESSAAKTDAAPATKTESKTESKPAKPKSSTE